MRLLTCLTQPLPLLSTEGKPCRKENSPFTPASWQLRFHPWNKSGVHQTVPEARPSWAKKWLRMYSHCSIRAASKTCSIREGYFLQPTSAACTQGCQHSSNAERLAAGVSWNEFSARAENLQALHLSWAQFLFPQPELFWTKEWHHCPSAAHSSSKGTGLLLMLFVSRNTVFGAHTQLVHLSRRGKTFGS